MWATLWRQARQRSKCRSLTASGIAVALVAWSILVIVGLTKSFTLLPSSLHLTQRCRMSRMWPSYVLYRPESPSGLDKKYRLFLYREANPGRSRDADKPQGRPALFVPGNAGSFGQVRSVASSAHHLFHSGQAGQGIGEVDWWTVDFNEDFSAFHGQTMHEQATFLNEVLCFLLKQYPAQPKVPILGHSMGGIVARLMMLKDNYPPDSVDTVITLSSPHAYPPVPLDKGVEEVYRTVNSEWKSTAQKTLLISLSGGILDNQLSSEPASLPLARLWDAKSSLSAFTSSLAGLWSGVDHLAMMWCDQLRERVARGVLRIEGQGKPLEQRREEWRRMLGIESDGEEGLNLLLSNEEQARDEEEQHASSSSFTTTIPVADADESHHGHFELFTTLSVGLDPSFGSPIEQDAHIRVDLCSSRTEGRKTCRHVLPYAYGLYPPSFRGEEDFPKAEERYELPGKGTRRLRLSLQVLKDNRIDSIRTDRRQSHDRSGMLVAGWADLPRTLTVSSPMWKPAAIPIRQREGSVAPSRETIVYGLDSSLLAYEMVAEFSPPATGCTPSALPTLQVKSLVTGDTQYFPSLHEEVAYPFTLHATSPYMPPASAVRSATKFTLLLDECGQVTALTLRVNWRVSAGLLMSRYRTALGAFPLASVFAVSAMTWEDWGEGGKFPLFSSTMAEVSPLTVPLLVLASLAFSALQQVFSQLFSNDGDMSPYIQNLSFGISGSPILLKALLSLTLVVTAYGLVLIVAHIVDFGLYGAAATCNLIRSRKGRLSKMQDAGSLARPKATLLGFAILVFAIWLAIPVQFVFLVLTLIQMSTTLRAVQDAILDGRKSSSAAHDHANQQKLLLNIYIWLLPFNAPALLIWTRNLLRGYYGLLSGPDHNVLAIVGFLCVSQISSTERVLGRVETRLATIITSLLFLSFSSFSLAYGIRYTHTLFSYANVLFCWLAGQHYYKQYTTGKGPKERDSARYSPLRDDDAVESLTLKAEVKTSFSNAPQEVVKESEAPESIKASLKDAIGYSIGESESDDSSTALKGRDILLERYLSLLDEYFACKQSISVNFSQGSFQLSKAKMQLGRVSSMNEMWDGRMKARLAVSTGEEGLHLISRLPESPDGGAGVEIVMINDKPPQSQLRKRNITGKVASDQHRIKTLTHAVDESEKKEASRRGGEETKEKKAQPFDPLYQFAALPPPSLRKAQSDFTDALRLLVGSKEGRGLLQIQLDMKQVEDDLRNS